MIRKILIWPKDEKLKELALACTGEEGTEIRQSLAQDMFDTMDASGGIGLAGPQIGVMKRVIVVDVTSIEKDTKPLALFNPKIIKREGKKIGPEGCLSIPGEASDVERSASIEVEYEDAALNKHTLTATGMLAKCIQHEIDHLDGVLFVDRISNLQKRLIRKRVEKKIAKIEKEIARYKDR